MALKNCRGSCGWLHHPVRVGRLMPTLLRTRRMARTRNMTGPIMPQAARPPPITMAGHVIPTRWRVSVLVSAAIAISYLDRQALPVAVQAIQRDIPLTNTQFGDLTSAFLLAYALMYAGGGVLLDRLGTRRGFLVIMIFWSLACASHSLATGVGLLAVSRLLLGAGEGGGFPAATKVIAEWFPVAERSTAMGIVNAGTAVGAVVAPPAIAAILAYGSWRWVFVACGAAGLVWAALWWVVYAPDTRS